MPFDPETPLVLHEADENSTEEFVLRAPLRWTGTFRGCDGELLVDPAVTEEKEFKTDLASVPRSLTWLFPRYGRYTKAAVLHDFLCQNFDKAEFACAPNGATGQTIELKDRSDADEAFREVMREANVPWLRRWLMWAAVTYKTLSVSLKEGRQSNPRLKWVGRVVTAAGAAGGVALLVQAVQASTWGGVILLTVLGLTAIAAGILGGGHVAQGRWDRWRVHLFALIMTVGFLPFLAAAAAVWALLAIYWILEDVFGLVRKALGRQQPGPAEPVLTPPPTPVEQRAAAVRAS
jgi:hypothetical protein